jgi:uncharacterized protein YkwD
MFPGRISSLVTALLFSAGCAMQSGPARFPVESISVPEEGKSYSTDARPDGAVGGDGIERVQAQLAAALAKRGDHAQPDGALSATASWALREVHQGRSVDSISAEAASRHFGFGGVVSGLIWFDMRAEQFWDDQLERMPKNIPITRYGIRVSPRGRSAAVVFGSMEVTYDPIARAFQPGQSVSLKGQVSSRFASAHVFLTKPDGTVDDKPMPGRAFDATFALETPGRYRLEVMGDGASGPVIVSNVPLYVGIPEPLVRGVAGLVVDPEQAEARMLGLLNEARRAARLEPLAPDAELREIALEHSTDMAVHHFVGHISPSSGSPEDRMRRAGVLVSQFGENVATAATPEEAHEGLMNSPGHRANMLRGDYTHVGVGARKNASGIVVTLNFGRRPTAAQVPTSATQVEAAILALRAAKSLPAPGVDSIYRVAAQAGAEALADGDDQDEIGRAVEKALQREVDRLRTSRPGACIRASDLLELSQLNDVPALVEPGLRRIGVGARTRHDSKGTRLSTVIMLEGVPCK